MVLATPLWVAAGQDGPYRGQQKHGNSPGMVLSVTCTLHGSGCRVPEYLRKPRQGD
jgi:hypothetical protein